VFVNVLRFAQDQKKGSEMEKFLAYGKAVEVNCIVGSSCKWRAAMARRLVIKSLSHCRTRRTPYTSDSTAFLVKDVQSRLIQCVCSRLC
jgi:hypothetical protein